MNKKSQTFRAVIFDMDGVITNTMPYHYRAWVEAMRPSRTPVTRHDVYIREGQPGINFVQDMSIKYQKNFSRLQANAILRKKEAIFKRIVKVSYFPGARKFIRSLHRSGYQVSLVTGTARHEMERMLPAALKDQFDVIVTGSDVRRGKPYPDPFLKAVRMLGVSKTKALVIENAPFGIRAAKKAGLTCYAVESYLHRSELKMADRIFKTIYSISRTIK